MTPELSEKLSALVERTQLTTSTPSVKPTGKVGLKDLAPDVLGKIQQAQKVELSIPSWTIDNKTVESTQNIPNFQKVMDDLLMGNNVFLVGEAGTGKTFMAEMICSVMYGSPQNYMQTLNCSQWTSPIDIIGGETIRGYRPGRLELAWKYGHLLVLDELPKLDPNTAGLLNDALAKSAALHTPQKPVLFTAGSGEAIPKHPRFRCIATGNITGKRTSPRYGGNNKQDGSLIDRFTGSYYTIGFNKQLEQALVFPAVFEVFNSMRDILLKNEIENDITLRSMLNANRTYVLEMERVSNNIPSVLGGKMLRDTIESYLSLHDNDTKELILKGLGNRLTEFYNSYRSGSAQKQYLNLRNSSYRVQTNVILEMSKTLPMAA